MEPLDEIIRENAAGPASVSGDAGTVQQRSVLEQIEADRYLAAKEAVKRPNCGLRFSKIVPPGAD